jgi:hypothetical protein
MRRTGSLTAKGAPGMSLLLLVVAGSVIVTTPAERYWWLRPLCGGHRGMSGFLGQLVPPLPPRAANEAAVPRPYGWAAKANWRSYGQ